MIEKKKAKAPAAKASKKSEAKRRAVQEPKASKAPKTPAVPPKVGGALSRIDRSKPNLKARTILEKRVQAAAEPRQLTPEQVEAAIAALED